MSGPCPRGMYRGSSLNVTLAWLLVPPPAFAATTVLAKPPKRMHGSAEDQFPVFIHELVDSHLMLGSRILHRHYDTRRDMSQANGRLRLIHMLPPKSFQRHWYSVKTRLTCPPAPLDRMVSVLTSAGSNSGSSVVSG